MRTATIASIEKEFALIAANRMRSIPAVLLVGSMLPLLGCHQVRPEPAARPQAASAVDRTPGRFMVEAWRRPLPRTNKDYVYLPITVNGHQATVILDLGGDVGFVLSPSLLDLPNRGTDTIGITMGTYTRRRPVYFVDGWIDTAYSVPELPPNVGLVGTGELSHYDLVFDGPAASVRLYLPDSASSTATAPGTSPSAAKVLPEGFTAADCVPLLGSNDNQLASFTMQVNGHPVSAFFDSGSNNVILDTAAAALAGIMERTTPMHRVPVDSMDRFPAAGLNPDTEWEVQGVRLAIGARQLTAMPVRILPAVLSSEHKRWMNIGLKAFRNQVVLVSYSTRQFCVSAAP